LSQIGGNLGGYVIRDKEIKEEDLKNEETNAPTRIALHLGYMRCHACSCAVKGYSQSAI
jgi:hypothetical protein